MEIEDLTKEELLRLIKNRSFYMPTQRDIVRARWESLIEEAKRITESATTESNKWTGDRTIEGYKKWRDAQELFDKGMKLYDKADIVYKELMAIGASPRDKGEEDEKES